MAISTGIPKIFPTSEQKFFLQLAKSYSQPLMKRQVAWTEHSFFSGLNYQMRWNGQRKYVLGWKDKFRSILVHFWIGVLSQYCSGVFLCWYPMDYELGITLPLAVEGWQKICRVTIIAMAAGINFMDNIISHITLLSQTISYEHTPVISSGL